MIKCLLWDFGNTLFDELSLWRKSDEWMQIYHSFDEPDGLGSAWCLGQIDTAELAARIAARTSLGQDEILAHLADASCFRAFPFTRAFYGESRLPQAIVTVNPADFRTLATQLDLHHAAQTIVISGEEASVDKGQLCLLALERMDTRYEPGEALLIDNKPPCLAEWSLRGGIGYHYRGDDAFRADVAQGIDALPRFEP